MSSIYAMKELRETIQGKYFSVYTSSLVLKSAFLDFESTIIDWLNENQDFQARVECYDEAFEIIRLIH